mmetsp:Transcript_96157/g.140518  ORF Transcript_96157/g.140518 Transcript_96157/m.140518 type:complete len:130 (+) Transcript_96157:39-428(+)
MQHHHQSGVHHYHHQSAVASEMDRHNLQSKLSQAKREAQPPSSMYGGHGHSQHSHSHSHRPSVYILVLEEYDIDALATDLCMRREDLKTRLQDPDSLQLLKVPQIKRILQHVRRKKTAKYGRISFNEQA